eukprot:425445-Prorocentrum_minimum.AAC.1
MRIATLSRLQRRGRRRGGGGGGGGHSDQQPHRGYGEEDADRARHDRDRQGERPIDNLYSIYDIPINNLTQRTEKKTQTVHDMTETDKLRETNQSRRGNAVDQSEGARRCRGPIGGGDALLWRRGPIGGGVHYAQHPLFYVWNSWLGP